MNDMDSRLALVSAPLRRLMHWLNRNSPSGSQRNIAAHYDLGNEFFALFLDDTMAYSCGIFETRSRPCTMPRSRSSTPLCRKLALAPARRLLEIGTGWGGLAVHAARHYGCHVTTTTISREQHA